MPDVTAARENYTLSENSSLMLDLLRAAASQAVVIGHGISYYEIWPRLQPPKFPYIQNLAVVVFFVLSGFLITYATVRKSREYRFGEFFIERFARIYSAYLIVLPLIWVIDRMALQLEPAAYAHGAAFDVRTFIGNVFMLQDHPRPEVHSLLQLGTDGVQITSFGSARPFWTLAIEWWIYMCFGWIVLRNRSKSGIVFFVVLAVLAVVPAYNILGGRGNGLGLVWIFGASLCLLASHRRISELRTDTLVLAAIGFGALSIVLLSTTLEPYDTKYAALFGVSMLCAVLAVDRVRWKAPEALAGALRFIANYSFTLYLLHYSILDLMVHHRIVGDPLGDFLLAVVVTNVASIAVAYFTEFRHRAFAGWLKRKFLAPQS